MASESGSFGLLTHGETPLPEVACPELDSNVSIQISDDLIQVYQGRIDALINQLGKDVILNFDPTRDPCINCEFDVVRNRSTGVYLTGGPRPFQKGRVCPYCKGIGFLETPRQECITCLIKWAPRDSQKYNISLQDYQGLVRLKTYAYNFSSLTQARTALVNHEISDIAKLQVKLVKFPILTGLRDSRYCISFWELLDET